MKKVLIITPYEHGYAASQRFRFEQYLDFFKAENIEYKLTPFWDLEGMKVLYQQGYFFGKVSAFVRGFFRRMFSLSSLNKYDVVFIHRETMPSFGGLFELLLRIVYKGRIVYDFDDAIWLENYAENNKRFAFLKSYKHVPRLCKSAHIVSVGNDYLKEYAEQFNRNVIVNPTTIDTDNHHNRVKEITQEKFVIGWTGTHSTIKYLENLVRVFKELEEKFKFKLVVICDQNPEFDLKSFEFIKWKKESEIDDLLKFNVGLMPLEDDIWAKGKCGFKALQYMALGIPALVSPVGVNQKIVDHGKNGFVCYNENDWKEKLIELLKNPQLASEMSSSAREKIESKYSVKSNKENFINLFN